MNPVTVAIADLRNLSFASPWAFGLLLLIPFMIWWRKRHNANEAAAMRFSSLGMLTNAPVPALVRWMPSVQILRYITIVAIIVCIARPRSSNVQELVNSEGIDIVLSMDISGSMDAQDLKPNRLEAAKEMAARFVDGRQGDRIGLVIFAGESFTQCPLTIDHEVIKQQIRNIRGGLLKDGTAIGMGLATAVDRLRGAPGKSRIVILLTDGVNNTGLTDPQTALEIAKRFQVKVYCIGVGSKGNAPYPVQTPFGTSTQMMPVEIDEPLMQKIAGETGGRYFRATDNTSLKNIYAEIDQLEKTSIEVESFRQYKELFFPFALIAIIALALELLLRYTLLRTVTE